ncbi:MAG: GTP-binding protein [Pseudomonadota bacterium]
MSIETSEDRIPVTLLTGFLGAGKTTLLNHLIRDPGAGRIAVIVNELGDVGVDHDLIEEETEETILLQSGCLCCSIRGDLLKTLGRLVARRNRGALAFDRVVIETTGIADPGPILRSLVVDRIVAPHFRMDGVVTVADTATGMATLDTQFEAVHQIALADLIVLSKTDLVSSAELSRFETRVAGINETAQRVRAAHGRVESGLLFGLSAMRPDTTSDDLSLWLGADNEKAHEHDHAHDHAHDHGAHDHHDHRIVSASIELAEPIPAQTFDFWLDTLIALRGADVLRMKGIVHLEGTDCPFVFHGVQHIFDAPVPLTSWSGGNTTSRVVVIARDMTRADLEANLECLDMRPKQPATQAEPQVEGMMAETAESTV